MQIIDDIIFVTKNLFKKSPCLEIEVEEIPTQAQADEVEHKPSPSCGQETYGGISCELCGYNKGYCNLSLKSANEGRIDDIFSTKQIFN